MLIPSVLMVTACNREVNHLLQDSKRASIANAAVGHFAHLTTSFIPDKLEEPFTATLTQALQSCHHNTNGMPSTNGVACVTQHVKPALMATTLAGANTLKVDVLDRLVDLRVCGSFRARTQGCGSACAGLIVGIAEPETPVREIRAHNKCIGWIRKIRRKDLAERPFGGGRCVADHYRDQRWDVVAICPARASGYYMAARMDESTHLDSIL